MKQFQQSMDWHDQKQKLARLRALDRTFQLFGADSHRYRLREVVSEAEMISAETDLNITLPTSLRDFYLQMGDGGAGPAYGVKPLSKLYRYRPSEPYRGSAYYAQLAKTKGSVDSPDYDFPDGYFELGQRWVSGLVGVIEEGCGHVTCVASAGPQTGHVVHLANEGYLSDTTSDFITHYTRWLDKNLALMETVAQFVDDPSYTIEDIYETVHEVHKKLGAHKLAASVIGAEFPYRWRGSRYDEFAWCADKLAAYRAGQVG